MFVFLGKLYCPLMMLAKVGNIGSFISGGNFVRHGVDIVRQAFDVPFQMLLIRRHILNQQFIKPVERVLIVEIVDMDDGIRITNVEIIQNFSVRPILGCSPRFTKFFAKSSAQNSFAVKATKGEGVMRFRQRFHRLSRRRQPARAFSSSTVAQIFSAESARRTSAYLTVQPPVL